MTRVSLSGWLTLAFSCLLSGCSTLPKSHVISLPNKQWKQVTLKTDQFLLLTVQKRANTRFSNLHIYIEGDGHAWLDAQTISPDPTPRIPTALHLAFHDTTANTAYLARPCQYVMNTHCHYRYWTYARFSKPIIHAMNQAVDQLKQHYKAKNITLIGFSGGGGMALLLAAQRKDVVQVIAVAGNLDTDAWTQFHHLTPLKDSINPITALPLLQQHTQLCALFGTEDKVFPPALVNQFKQEIQALKPDAKIRILPDIGHTWPAQYIIPLCNGQPSTRPAHTD